MCRFTQSLLFWLVISSVLDASEYKRLTNRRYVSPNGGHFAIVERIPQSESGGYLGHTGPSTITFGTVGSSERIHPSRCEIIKFSVDVDGEFFINEELWIRTRLRGGDVVHGTVRVDTFPHHVLVSDNGEGVVTIHEDLDANELLVREYDTSGKLRAKRVLPSGVESFVVDCLYNSRHLVILLCDGTQSNRKYRVVSLQSSSLFDEKADSSHLSLLVETARVRGNRESLIASVEGPIFPSASALERVVFDGESFDAMSALSVLSMLKSSKAEVPAEYLSQLRAWVSASLPQTRDDDHVLGYIRSTLGVKGE